MVTERLMEKLKTRLSEKLKTWLSVKLEDPAAGKAVTPVTEGAETKKPWCRLMPEFPQGLIWGKAYQGFFHTQGSNSRSLVKGETTPSTAPRLIIFCFRCTTLESHPGHKSWRRGKVLLSFKDNLLAKVGVRFDKPFPYSIDLGGLCDDSHGYFCQVSELCLDVTGVDDLDKLLANTLFEVVFSESRNSPFILFMIDAEKLMAGNSESYSTFKSQLEKLPDDIVIIGSHAHTDNHKEKDVFNESRNSPFILFMKDAEELMAGKSESYSTFKSQLEKLPDNVVIIGSHAHTDNHEEKVQRRLLDGR